MTSSSERPVRVRFAPSPTGPLHMGGVRTALYNYLFARKHGGTFLLRIEDTDQTRFVPGAEDYIQRSLAWCGLEPAESPWSGGPFAPYRQSERKALYRPVVDQLLENGKAYMAFDTEAELESLRDRAAAAGHPNFQYNQITRGSLKNSLSLPSAEVQSRLNNGEPYVVRLKLERNEEVRFFDRIRGWVTVNTQNMDDKVLFKSDGMPTYHLANVVDDHLMNISHVIRGEEWLPSAPLHVLLYRAFGWEDTMPEWAHLPLLLRPDGHGKLSKRDGDRLGFPVFPLFWSHPDTGETAQGYREMGFYPEGFVNMIAFLGWNPGGEQEIFSLDELADQFDLDRVSKSGARFDFEKARWFNQQHLRMRTNQQLAQDIQPWLAKEHLSIPDRLDDICGLVKERAHLSSDLLEEGRYFFEQDPVFDDAAVQSKWKPGVALHLDALRTAYATVEPHEFEPERLETVFKEILAQQGVGFGLLGPVLRIALTGTFTGPSAFAIAHLLGKTETLRRLQRALDELPA
ncbi:glutamate--tRNA ligase [bacterium]|nr:glutamate--tRNA ligase [bacterium]